MQSGVSRLDLTDSIGGFCLLVAVATLHQVVFLSEVIFSRDEELI